MADEAYSIGGNTPGESYLVVEKLLEVAKEAGADAVLAEVDFASLGTNDLTQYTLAVDRQHPQLAGMADSLHPAVLRLIAMTVEGARRHDRWVGVCGGLAGEPLGAELLASDERDVIVSTGEPRRRTFFIAAAPSSLIYDGSDDLLNPTRGFRLGGRLSGR